MPPNNLHMTTLEVAHSLTPDAVEKLVILAVPYPLIPYNELTNPRYRPSLQPSPG